ncbi:MAG: Rieske 2Fe-2S domain-containing protein [Fischerella sp.]|uniref:Rieske (2Fe-2S) protein n=1 Tax=Fischerella sp. TaxID=1191 RepID=UPI0017AAA44C|nr:Rieske 2Fe-2S domain-containing protein [Fischerella sp.]NWF60405.1 Rieske 2Fe-2S domain-containing protein [Fischerella sp.]
MAQALEATTNTQHYVRVAQVTDVKAAGCQVIYTEGQAIALFSQGEKIYAIDNRCPHMGFPLHRGTVKDCILTCHWHHARFDLASGGTFDAWADDVRAFPVEIRDGEVWVDLAPHADPQTHQHQRLQDGLEQGISLVIAKSVIALLDAGVEPTDPFRIGLDFGVRYRKAGWGAGLTMHTCMMNLLPYLDPEDRPRALYHGLAAVARDCTGQPPRFEVHPLPTSTPDIDTLKRWFRQFIEVRDAEGAERCLVSAVRGGADQKQIAEMLFTAATDHRYIDVGHAIDFTNKALEALDATGWQNAESVLTSLVAEYASAERMEESNSWRYPIDLVAILDRAFAELPAALELGRNRRGTWSGREKLVLILLGEDAQAIADSLLEALRSGCSEEELAGVVAYAAALRIARFHTNNDFGDWDTAHHSFTFANAVHQGLRRVASQSLLRGVFDAAMSVYLNRFLNVPPARLPEANQTVDNPETLLDELPELLNRQQQVNEAGALVARYLYSGGNPDRLLAVVGKLLLREDRSFHVIQEIEAAVRQYNLLCDTTAGIQVLIAAVRYLAAHAPTMRSQGQTYQMAERLHRGDRLFEDS